MKWDKLVITNKTTTIKIDNVEELYFETEHYDRETDTSPFITCEELENFAELTAKTNREMELWKSKCDKDYEEKWDKLSNEFGEELFRLKSENKRLNEENKKLIEKLKEMVLR